MSPSKRLFLEEFAKKVGQSLSNNKATKKVKTSPYSIYLLGEMVVTDGGKSVWRNEHFAKLAFYRVISVRTVYGEVKNLGYKDAKSLAQDMEVCGLVEYRPVDVEQYATQKRDR